jgi:protein-disulfide isomerase
MSFKTLRLLAATALATASLLPLAAQAQQDDPAQSDAAGALSALTRDEIEAVVHDYIVAHPEVVVEALNAYQAQQDAAAQQAQIAALTELSPQIFSSPTSPVVGNPDGDVTLVEFFDYQCGYCKRMEPARAQLIDEDSGLRIVMKEFPILGPASITAARASLAAERQGRYEDFHETLMNFRGTLTDDVVYQTAADLGLDMDRLREDMKDPAIAEELRANMDLAQALGVNGTPAFIINGQIVPGAVGYDRLKAEIEAQRGS